MTYAFIIFVLFMGGLVLHAFWSSNKAKKENAWRRAEAVSLNKQERQRKHGDRDQALLRKITASANQTYSKKPVGKSVTHTTPSTYVHSASDDTLLNTILATAVINDSFVSSDNSPQQDTFSGGGGEFGGGGSSGSWDTGSSSSYDSGGGFDSGSSGSFGGD